MNANKLAKTLKKELLRNPKKTAALAFGLALALWFWAPLVSKWFGGKPAKSKAPVAAAPATGVVGDATKNAPPADNFKLPAWDKLLDQIARDQNMQTATAVTNSRDPFRVTKSEQTATTSAGVEKGPPVAIAIAEDPTPQAVGIVLEATFISAQDPRATISGRLYRVGQIVSVARPGAVPAPMAEEDTTENAKENDERQLLQYQVELIAARRVVLTRKGKRYELKIKNPALWDGEDTQLTSQATAP